jgi:hypothetical protein
MAIEQPIGTDKLNNPSHSLSHRVFANDESAPVKSVEVDSNGDISIPKTLTSSMNKQVDVWHAYGGFQNNATTISCTQNVWAKITNVTSNLWVIPEKVGITIASDDITIENPGDYIGHLTIALSQANNDDFFIRCMNITQNKQQGYIIGGTTSGTNNFLNLSLPLYLENVVANDVFQFQIENISNNDDPIVRSAVFYISYLHN